MTRAAAVETGEADLADRAELGGADLAQVAVRA